MEETLGGGKELNSPQTFTYFDDESVVSEESASPKSIDSEYSYDTTESSLEDEQSQYTSDDCVDSSHSSTRSTVSRQCSIVDGLLTEIYDRYHHNGRSLDSDNITEGSTASVYSGSFELDERTQRWTRSQLNGKDVKEIRRVLDELSSYVTLLSGRLVRQLKRRDKNAYKLQRNFDILTAILQAVSLKRRVDARIKFSFIPQSGKKGFRQWLDSFKAVSRLPQGVPGPWRRRLWLMLAESKLGHVNWRETCKFCFNERSNPDDDNLGAQIVKDLHRTGCSWFCEFETPEERAILKRVLLAYARWNKAVGYCQGFNVIAALILQVVDRSEEDALKVMVYLIDFVLPANYFSNNLRSLSVDMAVLRELMKIKLPDLSEHLEGLQRHAAVRDYDGSSSYEPPLTNVFTMQWFLTLFATCLPEGVVLRVWDCILLEGSEVLLRVSLAIWAAIGLKLEDLESSDEFYGAMGRILPEIQEGCLINGKKLMNMVYNMAPFPFPKVVELREKYTYNITPFANDLFPDKKTSVQQEKSSKKVKESYISSDEEEDDVHEMSVGCLGLLSPQSAAGGGLNENTQQKNTVFSSDRRNQRPVEVSALQKQYDRTRKMQQQAVVVFSQKASAQSQDLRNVPPAINHLFVVTRARRNKWKEHARKERQHEKLGPVREEEEEREKLNEHLNEANEHLVGLFKGENGSDAATSGPTNEPPFCEPGCEAGSSSRTDVDTRGSSRTVELFISQNNSVSREYNRRNTSDKTSLSKAANADPALVLPDNKSVYPAKFKPFPGNRTKHLKNGLLYSKRSELEGSSKREAFISGPPVPPLGKDESTRKGVCS